MAFTKSLGWLVLSFLMTYVRSVGGLASTDTITWGGDVSRSGYQTNHNMDPAIVGSASFGQLFRTRLPGNFNGIGAEQVFSQPLVYTGSDGVQYVYLATTQNNIYKLDAKTGAIVAKRNLWVPFLTADLDGCVDINPTVGVTATGVIDPSTGYWYFTAKTYSSQYQNGNFSPSNTPGRLNGRYYFHAINTADLSDAFAPTPVEGTIFRNNPNRMFLSGNQHQRPALLQVGDFIYTGWASHCVKWNFTGAIIGFNRNNGAIVEAYAMEGGPEANTIPGGGVWMSGGGLAYDGKGSMYFATGNGYASQLPATGQSVPGRNPPTALEEAAVNAKINDNGTISIIDFFMPWEKTQLDGADKDLGTSPLEILPSDTFSCPLHKRIGVVTGKSGKTYWLNLDDLGGYQMGANKLDNVIQVYQNENSVYAGAGVMPLGGGYIYINVIQYPAHVFKFSCNAQGAAVFTHIADTNEKNAYILGVGHGTTTSLNGQDGTGLYWVSDVEGKNLRIYNAIPPTGGNLTLINSFNVPSVTKFTRPVFGDGRVYMGTTDGSLYGFGSPVSLPLNCSSPYTFPKTPTGNTSAPIQVTCLANVATTVNTIALTGNPNFNISGLPTLPLTLNQGNTFSFKAIFVPHSVGLLSSDVVVNTTNGPTGYATRTPITLQGTANSVSPLFAIRPNTVSFNTIAGQAPDAQTVIFANDGDSLLTFQNISYSLQSETGPWVTPNTTSGGSYQVGSFNFTNVPTNISGNSVSPVTINYNPPAPGNDAVFVKGFSNGGNVVLDIVGVAGSQPVALFQFLSPDGSTWVNYVPGQNFTFGNVTENTTRNLQFRVTNNGSSTAAALSITVSKPPYGVPGFVGAANNVDLGEGSSIAAGQSQNATLYCSPPKVQVNTPSYSQTVSWTINTGDPKMGKQVIYFTCNAVAEQVGPLLANGSAQYPYIGCAKENNPGRQLAVQLWDDSKNNTNDRCIAACYAANWTFASTQYTSQCWCGNAIPNQFDTEADCNFQCTGNTRETCGGNGRYGNSSHLSVFADSTKFNGNTTSAPLQITQSYGSYVYNGCYAESGGKTLTAKSMTSNSLTVESCGAFCSPYGYTYFGVEYGQECYCGNALASSSSLTSDSQCSMTCKGSNSEYCGAGSRMQIYALNSTVSSSTSSSVASTASTSTAGASTVGTSTTTVPGTSVAVTTTTTTTTSAIPSTTGVVPSASGYVSMGCYSDNAANKRVLANLYANDSMTIEMCAAQALSKSAAYFGVEYGRECWYGPTLDSSSQPLAQSKCNMLCPGNSAEYCGAGNALQLYSYTTSTSSSTSASPTSTTVATTTTTSAVTTSSAATSTTVVTTTTTTSSAVTTSAPTSTTVATTTTTTTAAATTGVVPSASGYASMGCYSDNAANKRVLANLYANDSMTIEMCAAQAVSKSAVYFGVEYGRECWYGPTLDSSSQPLAQSKCSFLCPGNSYEYCGAGNALQLYSLSTTTSTTSSTASSTVAATTTSSAAASTSATSTSAVSSSTTAASSTTVASTTAAPSTSTAAVSSTVTTFTSTTSALPSQTPIVCPDSNSTTWRAPSGANFFIECSIDHQGGDINSTHVNTYEACITACDNQKGCVDISMSGTACYMKGTLGKALSAPGLFGARLLPNTTSTTTTMMTSTKS